MENKSEFAPVPYERFKIIDFNQFLYTVIEIPVLLCLAGTNVLQ